VNYLPNCPESDSESNDPSADFSRASGRRQHLTRGWPESA
jgi:hypothetical protein